MRAAFEVGLLLGLMGLSAGIAALGCSSACDPDFSPLMCPDTSSGSTGGVNEACDPTQKLDAPVADDCGVFVRLAGDDSNQGTKEKPVKTIATAIERWKDKPKTPGGGKSAVYVCSEEFTVTTRADLPSGLVMFGGLDCNATGDKAWVYVAPDQAQTETVITAPEGTIPLRILPSADNSVITILSDVHVTAKTVPELMLGVSSIAVIAEEANVELVRSVLETGNAAKGEDARLMVCQRRRG